MGITWTAQRFALADGGREKIVVSRGGKPASFMNVIAGWQKSEACRSLFLNTLAETACPAFFWEMPAVRRDGGIQTYECVTIHSQTLFHMQADGAAFAELWKRATETVVTFRNLGGDATLVVPCPVASPGTYAHLAAFVRAAPVGQQHEFLRLLGCAAEADIQAQARVWISTSGLGVPWLHARIDTWPKYYQHRPYGIV